MRNKVFKCPKCSTELKIRPDVGAAICPDCGWTYCGGFFGFESELERMLLKYRIKNKLIDAAEPGTTINGNVSRTSMFVQINDAIKIVEEG